MEESVLKEVIDLAGLRDNGLEQELMKVAEDKHLDADQLTIDELRKVMETYLNQIFLEIAENETGELN